MLLGVYLKNKALSADPGFLKMKSKLEGAGAVMYEIDSNDNLQDGTDAVLSVGGDGTFRGATDLTNHGIPTIGVTGTVSISDDSAFCRRTVRKMSQMPCWTAVTSWKTGPCFRSRPLEENSALTGNIGRSH